MAGAGAATAVFVPNDPARGAALAVTGTAPGLSGEPGRMDVVTPVGATGFRRRTVDVLLVPWAEAVPALATLDLDHVSPSLAAWSTAVTAGIGLVARGRLLPSVSPDGFDSWRVGPLDAADTVFLRELAAAFPPEAYAVPVPGARRLMMPSPEPLIRLAWDAVADVLVRTSAAADVVGTPLFSAREPQPVDPTLRGWLTAPAQGVDAGARPVLRLDLPSGEAEPAYATLAVRSTADPSLLVDAAQLWQAPAAVLARLGEQAETDLLLGLRRASRAWPPLTALLSEAAPVGLALDDDAVADLLGDAADALAGAGVEVLWPSELFADALELRATTSTPSPGSVTEAGFNLEALLEFRWQLTLAGEALTAAEVDALAEAKRPLVRLRGRWVAADPALIARALERRTRRLSALEALAGALTGTLDINGEQVAFEPPAPLRDLVSRLAAATGGPATLAPPADLVATLRPYQQRGFAWLTQMTALGLGGCLADDMGLGKTIQVIALHLHRRALAAGPTLVVCPTSLLGNWQRELARFAPTVAVRRFHGGARHLDEVAPAEVVLVTYGVVRRDREVLAEIDWGLVVADEAQQVKNPLSRTARELRRIPATARVALTGTPVENRLTDLWALLDWTTPGLLGGLEHFRSTVAVPVERHRDPDATDRLTRLTRPFLLRRRKTDPGIAPELPPKTETDRVVGLTSEQATLYEAVVRETMATIKAADGIERRGLVLKLLTALKQICNHPAQYLGQRAPIPGRSGKLAAFEELVDIITAEGDGVLVFTQYVAMARLLETHLAQRGIGTLFLHGGVTASKREAMAAAFQAGDAPVFLLSLKAGGVGLNLTRATHVIHYDRWWNPAVEDQATDRAYRIGQDRPVQVHRLVTEGTLEDRIATLINRKREIADAVVGSGEGWISDLSNTDLHALVRLGGPQLGGPG